ncbi:MAG: site-specific integrase, partial [Clostridia bacterium]|nr:site-specific integrase [Clostridia bacterium]
MNQNKNSTVIKSDETISELQQQVCDGKLSPEDFTRLVEENMTNKLILKDYDIKQAPDGRYWVRVPWKKGAIRKTTFKAVEQEILKHFKENVPTLASIYPEYKGYRLLQIKPGTFRKDVKNFEKFIKDSPLANKPITQLTIKDGYQWFLYCKDVKPNIKEKYFNNVKSTLNSLMEYAIENQIITINPFERIKIDTDHFVPPTHRKDCDKVFSEEEQKAIIEKCYSESKDCAIPLGIVLLFHTGIRSGELCALKWCDVIDDKKIHIQRQVVENDDEDGNFNGYKVVNHTKSKSGDRILVLNTDAQNLLKKIKMINFKNGIGISQDDFIFQRKVKGEYVMCNTRSFEPRLKRYCREVG